MDNLLESLEAILDGLANPEYEVEYHVHPISRHCLGLFMASF